MSNDDPAPGRSDAERAASPSVGSVRPAETRNRYNAERPGRMAKNFNDGCNIRRVDIKRGGAVVASFYLAVFGHPGGKKRADTAADIEVPAQLLRDLFDGVTHMDALEIDADAL